MEEFAGLVSDGGPITLAVDIASAEGTDEYADEVEERQGYYCITDTYVIYDDEEENRFCYFVTVRPKMVITTWRLSIPHEMNTGFTTPLIINLPYALRSGMG